MVNIILRNKIALEIRNVSLISLFFKEVLKCTLHHYSKENCRFCTDFYFTILVSPIDSMMLLHTSST